MSITYDNEMLDKTLNFLNFKTDNINHTNKKPTIQCVVPNNLYHAHKNNN